MFSFDQAPKEDEVYNATGAALVVEDEAIVQLELIGHLEGLGLQVNGVARGEQAVELAETTAFDLVMMDVRLGGQMSGVDAAQRIRKLQPTCQIVFVTAFDDEATVEKAKSSSPSAYLMKPFDRRTLLLTVELALQRGHVERERRAREAMMERHLALVEASHDGIVSVDAHLDITFFNQGAERIFGWRADEVVGKPLHVLLPAEHRDMHRVAIDGFRQSPEPSRAMHERSAERSYFAGVTKDGSALLLDIAISKSQGTEPQSYLAVVRDCTESARLEEELRRGHRMDAIGRMATGVVHDLNNLLTMVSCSASLLRATHGDDDHLQQIFAACAQGAQLTHNLLRVARSDHANEPRRKPHHTQLSSVVHELTPLLMRTLPKHMQLGVYVENQVMAAGVAPSDVEQIVINLFINARDALQTGEVDNPTGRGDIRICVERTPPPDRGTTGTDEPWPCITVQDDGVGMSAAVREQAVEPFFTTKDEGNGVGLSTVYSLVKQAGGVFHIESESGVGTKVGMWFPPADQAADDERPHQGAVPGEGHVWLLEANKSAARLDELLLTSAGYTVWEFVNADELRAALQDGLHPDVLLTEPLVGGTLGAELAHEVRQAAPNAAVVFASAAFELYADLPLGPAPFVKVRRPYGAQALTQAVAKALQDAGDLS